MPIQPPEPSQTVSAPLANDRTLEPIPELNESPTQPVLPPSMDFGAEDRPGTIMVTQDAQNDMDMETTDIPSDAPPSNDKFINLQTGMHPSPSSKSMLSSIPPLEMLPTSPEPSEAQVDPTSDSSGNLSKGWTADDWPTNTWDA